MHLLELLRRRSVPAAGLFVAVTRRCPLSCDHCSTNSTLEGDELPAAVLRRFVATFTPENRPELLLLTGGEALLRPRLVAELTDLAHAVGTRVDLTSGMFFLRQRRVPARIAEAIARVDHFTASLDVFHERQVPRAAVLRFLRELLDRGQDVSLQVVGLDADDPYLAEVTADVRRVLDDRAPVVVAALGAVGRARRWLKPGAERTAGLEPSPCELAAWPVVAFDGTVVACCSQAVVDGPRPPHLCLGHAAVDDWATVRERYLASPLLRAVRLFGPEYVARAHAEGIRCRGYCGTCRQLSADATLPERLAPLMARPSTAALEQVVAGMLAEGFAERHAVPGYAHLARLGLR